MGSKTVWEEMTWPEISQLARQQGIVIVPIGALEQHGPHLPVFTDAFIVSSIARQLAQRLSQRGVPSVAAPVLWATNSVHHMSFPGTITLNYSTFAAIVKDVCSAISRHGFTKIVLLNGHGGNVYPLRTAVTEINVELGRPVFVVEYWQPGRSLIAQILDRQEGIMHACEMETSLMLALAPHLVGTHAGVSGPDTPDPVELKRGAAYTFRTYRNRSKSGVIGDTSTASADKGSRILEVILDSLVDLFEKNSLWEITL